MYHCLQYLTGEHLKPSVIIGTDSPTLPKAHILAAFSLLEGDADAVLGPAEDGGYYLVGCRQPHPRMFAHVSWSSHETLAQTRTAFDAVGYQTHLTPLGRDVDSIEDVRRLDQAAVGPSVQYWLRKSGQGSPF